MAYKFEGEWTYCGEGTNFPEKQDEYYITWTGVLGGKRTKPFVYIIEWNGMWLTHEIARMGYTDIEVIAWMPLPEAYCDADQHLFKEGDIVTILVDNPAGVSAQLNTKGKLGIVREVRCISRAIGCLVSWSTDVPSYLFSADELRLATAEEKQSVDDILAKLELEI